MLCTRVQNLLSAYCDSELTGAEMLSIRQHLSQCPDCRREHESLRQVKLLFGAVSAPQPPRPFTLADLEARQRSRRVSSRLAAFAGRTVQPWLQRAGATYRSAPRAAAALLTRQLPAPLALGGAAAVAGIALGIVQQPQVPDAVSARVPEMIAADGLPQPLPPDWQVRSLVPALPSTSQPVSFSGRVVRRARPAYSVKLTPVVWSPVRLAGYEDLGSGRGAR